MLEGEFLRWLTVSVHCSDITLMGKSDRYRIFGRKLEEKDPLLTKVGVVGGGGSIINHAKSIVLFVPYKETNSFFTS